ncbi:phosphatidylglycerophosphatase A family protein [Eoetvoesiella caeni]|uniref:Phosphatidylglycerophosphatase A n=1 Tax=Eoetvoesiella caeni TaxID=645616 RepID=A0A366GZW5_9BURK|nr:phosphatidylglycerophosphatase A [Eoetvoesiella caeni]MCI2811201.1 phosphatidylglycerophosphatase A [Eoetvoesiella caeni]NYT57055.1 phosphatidylglycerophosphatase A [Eoetvoesiella caeni]RBP35014.1 phosphatidylglycerophosphatase [Eoetvoesiella caeni]
MAISESGANSSTQAFRPTWPWMLRSPLRIVALGFGSGLLRPGPGTWGTVLAWALWVLGARHLGDAVIAAGLVALFALGCWCCQRTGQDMGEPDSSTMVWDEMVAFWLVLWLTPDSLLAQAVAFAAFRFFDIIKPPPIRYFDKHLKHGFGVMWDDLLAAGYSLLLLAILVRTGVLS